MPKKTLAPKATKKKKPDEPLTEREVVQGLALSLGRALALTGQVAVLAPGSLTEDTAIKAMDEAWVALAGDLHDWAQEGKYQGEVI